MARSEGATKGFRVKRKGRTIASKSLLDEDLVKQYLVFNGTSPEEATKLARRIVDYVFYTFVKSKTGRTDNFALEGFTKEVQALFADWSVLTTTVLHEMTSSNKSTTKLLVKLQDDHEVECVVLRHNKRTTICISSQVGCKMGCTFCATGALGYEYNLMAGEIVEQLVLANQFLQRERSSFGKVCFSNVVFMGMGEPLNNYKSVVCACESLTSVKRFNMSPARISVSTVGVVSRMKTIHADLPGVCLALSLHAPTQELRQKIIPTATAYPLHKILDAVQFHLNQDLEKCVMIEYILLSGVNDTEEIAEQLAELLQPMKHRVKVNLIPYNPIFNPQGLAVTFKAPSASDVEVFKNVLQKQHNIFCTVRTEMGQDVNGACGQLACVSKKSKKADVDIEDLFKQSRLKQQQQVQVVADPVEHKDSYKWILQALVVCSCAFVAYRVMSGSARAYVSN